MYLSFRLYIHYLYVQKEQSVPSRSLWHRGCSRSSRSIHPQSCALPSRRPVDWVSELRPRFPRAQLLSCVCPDAFAHGEKQGRSAGAQSAGKPSPARRPRRSPGSTGMPVASMRKGETDEGVGGPPCLPMASSCFGLIDHLAPPTPRKAS